MVKMRPRNASLLSSHLVCHSFLSDVQLLMFILTFIVPFKASLESQFEDGREWLFDTEQPGLADISLYFIFAWIRTLPTETAFNPKIHSCTIKVCSLFYRTRYTSLNM